MNRNGHRDRLTEFSHRLTQIKFIVFEVGIFVVFCVWVWDKVKHEFGF